ncbi:hypothetical protein [Acidipila sp. EB88]|uniref:hypothetical protein n=1 Tax=Acidipila sp. EB88 TaxID=2305226 RepID=UPI000F5DF023|nr:hypothetical protein [Acidipila sp. EB88]RRA47493.1 hypothetical protein D1Y84_03460 [Acidipila sp. EB88]
MWARRRFLKSTLQGALLTGATATLAARAQTSSTPASTNQAVPAGPINHTAASTLFPATVFFAGRVAPVQLRNTGGARLSSGFVLSGLVDTSGYSSGVQERYQAYLLLDTPARFGSNLVHPGAYGCGIVNGKFLLLDLSAATLFELEAARDTALPRPTPLQVLAGSTPDSFRLYLGRGYVSFSA